MENTQIFCCGCNKDIKARLTNGVEIYQKPADVSYWHKNQDYLNFPFWICDVCKNYVGCHHKTEEPTKPLGCIPTPEIRKWRGYLHRLIDKNWKTSKERKEVYSKITKEIGCQYHSAEIRSVEEAKKIYSICKNKLNF
jgi:hypothetical protein